MDTSPSRVFTQEEVERVQTTWKTLVKDGTSEVGLVLLYRFFVEVPEVKSLFYEISVDDLPQNFTKEDMRRRQKIFSHAKRLGSVLDSLIGNMTREERFVKKCTNLGIAHKKYKVQLRHFDLLGEVLIRLIEQVLQIDSSHPTTQAWAKAYRTIAEHIKKGLTS